MTIYDLIIIVLSTAAATLLLRWLVGRLFGDWLEDHIVSPIRGKIVRLFAILGVMRHPRSALKQIADLEKTVKGQKKAIEGMSKKDKHEIGWNAISVLVTTVSQNPANVFVSDKDKDIKVVVGQEIFTYSYSDGLMPKANSKKVNSKSKQQDDWQKPVRPAAKAEPDLPPPLEEDPAQGRKLL